MVKRKFAALSLLLSFFVIAAALAGAKTPAPNLSRTEISSALDLHDPETRLAVGVKLKFSTADLYQLEMIPGIGDVLADPFGQPHHGQTLP